MTPPGIPKRRKILIDRRLQLGFAKWVLVLVAAASAGGLGFFIYGTSGTLTMNYDGAEIQVLRTFDFFLPIALLSMVTILLLTSVIGIVALVYYSHRIAGPLYRFRVALDALNKGDLTVRFKLRTGDELIDMADTLNSVSRSLDDRVGAVQEQADRLLRQAEDLQRSAASLSPDELDRKLRDITNNLSELRHGASSFTTSIRS
jgi:methyl-accepting chemotaxis protein